MKKKKMINQLVEKEFRFVAQHEEHIKRRLKCKYRNMKKKLLKTYYKDNIIECLLGNDIWVDTDNGYKVMTVDNEAVRDWTWIYGGEEYVQLEFDFGE